MCNMSLTLNFSNSTSSVAKPSPAILFVMLLISSWIILINGLVFTCFLISRNTLRKFVNIQMLSFSVTDMCVGFSALSVTMSYQNSSTFLNFEACLVLFYGYCISQTANLFHAFGVCLHRIIIIKRSAGRRESNSKSVLKTLLFHLSTIWILSVFLVSIPFGLYGQFGVHLDECSLNSLFGDNYIYFVAVMGSIFIMPQIAMNIVYIYMLRFLLLTWRNMNYKHKRDTPFATRSNEDGMICDTHPFLNESMSDNKTKSIDFKIEKMPQTIVNKSAEKGSDTFQSGTKAVDNRGKQPHRKIRSVPDKSFSFTEYEETYHDLCDLDSIKSSMKDLPCNTKSDSGETITLCEMKTNPYYRIRKRDYTICGDQCNKYSKASAEIFEKCRKPFARLNRRASKHRNSRRLGYKRQRRVLITIGMILLAVNIFMTPLNLLSVIELNNGSLLTRKVKFSLMALALMNSVFNPVIYSLRIRPFRHAFVSNWNICCSKLHFK